MKAILKCFAVFSIFLLGHIEPSQAAISLSFAPPVNYTTSQCPGNLKVADLNRDSWPDVAYIGPDITDSSTLRILTNTGNGTFKSEVTHPFPKSNSIVAEYFDIGDLNHDGKQDIVINNGITLMGTATNTFRPITSFTGSKSPIQLADLNRDGNLDVVSSYLGYINWQFGIGTSGKFQYSNGNVNLFADRANGNALISDVNNDGILDLVGASYYTLKGLVGDGIGFGTFNSHNQVYLGDAGRGRVESIAVGDFNRDGNPDLVTANIPDSITQPGVTDFGGHTVSVLRGTRSGTFATAVNYPVGQYPTTIQVNDINRDGKLDLVVLNAQDNNAGILLGIGNGQFSPQITFTSGISAPEFSINDVAISDLNRDGKLDLIFSNCDNNTVSVLFNNGQ